MLVSRLLKSLRPPAHSAPRPAVVGEFNELSDRHGAGWAYDPRDPGIRIEVEAVLDGTGEVLAKARADQFVHGMAAALNGDGAHGFYLRWPRPLSAAERARVRIRPAGGADPLPPAHWVRDEYNPLMHLAMDIVDNCNLRCPFCLYDYADTHTTHVMDEATLAAALRFLPYVRDGEFWFSCLHEPTLHPKLTALIDRVPREYRRKIFFTTNLAKRMPPSYFEWLASSGLHHINVSIESRDPAIYERMRQGARHRIFAANWEALLTALPRGAAPPRLQYIAMAYKSNLRELPELTAYLLGERQADLVEVRHTYEVPHLPAAFRQAEFLDPDEWHWLGEQFSQYPPDRVRFLPPPDAPAAAPEPPVAAPAAAAPAPSSQPLAPQPTEPPGSRFLVGRYMFRLSWDGSLRVLGVLASSRHDNAQEEPLLGTNIRDITDPLAFLERLETSR